MKFAIHDLDYEQFNVAVTAVNDMGGVAANPVPATQPVTPVETPTNPVGTEVQGVVPVSGVELDAAGIPWDVRIHAGTKTKTGKGMWKKLKGVNKDIIPGIEAELKASVAAPTPVQQPVQLAPVPPVIQAQPAQPQQPMQPPVQPVQPVQPTVPAAMQLTAEQIAAGAQVPVQGQEVIPPEITPLMQNIATAQASPCRTDITHEQMMNQVNVALQDPNNIVTATDLPVICGAWGMQSVNDCLNNPEVIGKIYWILGGQ